VQPGEVRPNDRRDTLLPLSPASPTRNLFTMRTSVLRLRQLAHGMCKEVTMRKADAGPLLPLEGKMYLDAVPQAIAGVDEAAMGLETALVRLEQLPLALDGREG